MDKAPPITPQAGNAAAGAGDRDLTGQTLGDFRVLRRLGKGGMGQVYLAEQISLKRKVALKILRAELAADRTALQRFRAEAEAVARATHANIVQIYASGEWQGLHFIALEYVEGRNLREFVARKGPPQVLLALSIMRQVAAALQRASELGIVHRDVKPENILLTRMREVKVADFGLSRCLAEDGQPLHLTQTGVTMGTPLYMSPEQVQGKPIDARTDIYSFGVTCYHMLAGHPPFHGNNPFDVALKHVSTEPEPLAAIRPDLPAELCAVVQKMMAKDPGKRYQNGRELLKELVRLRESVGQSGTEQGTEAMSMDSLPTLSSVNPAAVPTASLGVKSPPRRRRWLTVAMVLSVFLALAGGAGSAWWLQRPAAATAGDNGAAEEPGLPEAGVTLHKREQFLKEAVEQYANPQDPAQTRLGLGHCLELGLFYLEQGRLGAASQLFARLANPNQDVRPYRFLGMLGQAIVLGLQNRAEESNEAFAKALFDPRQPGQERPEGHAFLKQNTRLHQWVAQALDYNHANQTPEHPFPQKLESLRHPFTPAPRGPGSPEKAPGKKS